MRDENYVMTIADLAFSLRRSEKSILRYIRAGGLPAVLLPSGSYIAERMKVAEFLGISPELLRRAPPKPAKAVKATASRAA